MNECSVQPYRICTQSTNIVIGKHEKTWQVPRSLWGAGDWYWFKLRTYGGSRRSS